MRFTLCLRKTSTAKLKASLSVLLGGVGRVIRSLLPSRSSRLDPRFTMDANASPLPSPSCMRSIRRPALVSSAGRTTRIRETLMALQQPSAHSPRVARGSTCTTDNFDHLRSILGQVCRIAEEAELLIDQIDWESLTDEGFDDVERKQ